MIYRAWLVISFFPRLIPSILIFAGFLLGLIGIPIAWFVTGDGKPYSERLDDVCDHLLDSIWDPYS